MKLFLEMKVPSMKNLIIFMSSGMPRECHVPLLFLNEKKKKGSGMFRFSKFLGFGVKQIQAGS